jgi:RNA polymerase sigma factor (sigma-70 family)
MAVTSFRGLLDHVYRTVDRPRPESDAGLLERYRAERDEAVFAELVRRHGPLVLGVCRRALGDAHAAEDAFQATFLTLARRAGAIRRRASLRCWLYGVAVRVCRKARSRGSRPTPPAAECPHPDDPAVAAARNELLTALDEELAGLPDRYRAPLILCYLDGRTRDEAAAHLGWSVSTLKRRLARGRDLLRARLDRRGFGLAAGLAAVLNAHSLNATVPATLMTATARLTGGAVAPAAVATLAGEVAREVAWGRLRAATGAMLALTVTCGAGLYLAAGLAGEAPDAPPDPPQAAAAPATDRFGDALPPGALARLGTVRMRHAHAQRVVPLPDGRTLISFGTSRTARLWDLATGRLLREFGPFPSITVGACPAVSPDGRWLAVPSPEAVRVWDVTTGRLAYTATDDGWLPLTYAFSPDNRLLASGGFDGKVRLRDAASGQLLRTGEKHRGRVTGLVFRDQDTLISGGEDRMVKTWDVATVTLRHEFKTGQRTVAALALTPDGALLATAGSNEKKVRLWEMPAGRELAVFDTDTEFETNACTLAFSPDGQTLAAGGWSSAVIQLWDVAKRRERKLPFGREQPGGRRFGGLRSITFTPDGRYILAPDYCHVLHCLDVNTGHDRFANDEHAGPVRGLSFTADGQRLLTGCIDASIRTYDLTGRLLKRQPAGHTTVFAPGGRIAVTWWGEEWWLMDLDTGRSWGRTQFGPGGLWAVTFAPDGRTVAVLFSPPGQPVGPQRTVLQLLETATGESMRTFDDAGFGEELAFTPDGRTLVLVERQETRERVHLWDVASGRTTGRLPVPQGRPCRDIAFSPDGRLLAAPRIETPGARQVGEPAIPSTASLAVLEIASGRERLRLRLEPTERGDEIQAVRFAPGGRDLVLGVDDGTVRIWDLAAGRERHRFAGSYGSVTGLAFSPDGRLMASGNGNSMHGGGSGEGTVLLWPMPPAPELATVPLPPDRPGRNTLWADLGSPDATRAGQVLQRLAADPAGAVALVRERLAPVTGPDAAHIARLVADLDAPRFAARTQAARELERLGEQSEPALRRALAGSPSAEVKAQVERLLGKLIEPVEHPDVLRAIRAVELLESVATPDARRVLETLATGDPAARLTREAQASLARLKRPS